MDAKRPKSLVFIYFAYLFGCLFVCLYPINVKTAEPRESLWMIKFSKFASIKFDLNFFSEIHEREHVHNLNRRCARSALKALFIIFSLSVDTVSFSYIYNTRNSGRFAPFFPGFQGASRSSFISFVKKFIRNKIHRGSSC